MKFAAAIAIFIFAFPAVGVAATRPEQLWRAYPLGTQKLSTSSTNAHEREHTSRLAVSPPPARPVAPETFSVGLVQVIAITGIVAAVFVLAPTAIIRRRAG